MKKRNLTTPEQTQAAEMERIALLARRQVTWLPSVLQVFAELSYLNAELSVIDDGRTFLVTWTEPEYNDREEVKISVDYSYDSSWNLNTLKSAISEAKEIEEERDRVRRLKASAMNKLSAEEREALGL